MAHCMVRNLNDSVKRKVRARLLRQLVCAAAVWLAAAGIARAQNAECDELMNTNVPYELRAEQGTIFPNGDTVMASRVNQVYRVSAGPKTTYSKLNDASVIKIVAYGPFLV